MKALDIHDVPRDSPSTAFHRLRWRRPLMWSASEGTYCRPRGTELIGGCATQAMPSIVFRGPLNPITPRFLATPVPASCTYSSSRTQHSYSRRALLHFAPRRPSTMSAQNEPTSAPSESPAYRYAERIRSYASNMSFIGVSEEPKKKYGT